MTRIRVLAALLLGVLFSSSGCGKKEEPPAPPINQQEYMDKMKNMSRGMSGPPGMQAFRENCSKCHTLPGEPEREKAMSLAGVAKDPNRNVDWFIEKIKNPTKSNPESKMPSFKDKLDDATIKSIAEMLSSMK